MKINVEISVGELIDKTSILEIKLLKIKDKVKIKEIEKEYDTLVQICHEIKDADEEYFKIFYEEIKVINLKLWEIEDQIRLKEKNKEFDNTFIDLARNVYKTNDERFILKNKINNHFGSEIKEQKDYQDYS